MAISPGGRPADDSPVGTPGGQQNWVDKAGGLPKYIRMVAHALMRKGMPKQHAIAAAVNRVKRWAAGADNVRPQVQAAAAAAVAEWEAKKGMALSAHIDAAQLLDLAVPEDWQAELEGTFDPTLTLDLAREYVRDQVGKFANDNTKNRGAAQHQAAQDERKQIERNRQVNPRDLSSLKGIRGLMLDWTRIPIGERADLKPRVKSAAKRLGATPRLLALIDGLGDGDFKADKSEGAGVALRKDKANAWLKRAGFNLSADDTEGGLVLELAAAVGDELAENSLIDLAGAPGDVIDLAPGDYRPPYDWKHGFIPVTPAAALSKAKKGPHVGKGNSRRPKGVRVPGKTARGPGGTAPKSVAGAKSPKAASMDELLDQAKTLRAGPKRDAVDHELRNRNVSPATVRQGAAAKAAKNAPGPSAQEKIDNAAKMHGTGSKQHQQARERFGAQAKAQDDEARGRGVPGAVEATAPRRGGRKTPHQAPTPRMSKAEKEDIRRAEAEDRTGGMSRQAARERLAAVDAHKSKARLDSQGFPDERKTLREMTPAELTAERDRMDNYIKGRAGGTATDVDVDRWRKRKRELNAEIERLPDREKSARSREALRAQREGAGQGQILNMPPPTSSDAVQRAAVKTNQGPGDSPLSTAQLEEMAKSNRPGIAAAAKRQLEKRRQGGSSPKGGAADSGESFNRKTELEGGPSATPPSRSERLSAERQSLEKRAKAAGYDGNLIGDGSDRLEAFLDAKAKGHPIPVGRSVNARQPGIEHVTTGRVVGYTDNGMVKIEAHVDRNGNRPGPVGTFNPSHVAEAGKPLRNTPDSRTSGGAPSTTTPTTFPDGQKVAYNGRPSDGTGVVVGRRTDSQGTVLEVRDDKDGKTYEWAPDHVKPHDTASPTASARDAEVSGIQDRIEARTGKRPTADQARAALEHAERIESDTPATSSTNPDAPIRIEHTPDGTLVHGTSREDAAAIKEVGGFKWSRNLNAWYLPRTWRPETRENKVRQLEAKLGDRAGVDKTTGPRKSAAEREADTRARAAERAERMDARADKRSAEANRRFEASDLREEKSGIPFGQPILVGHHSERRHRRAIERAHANLGKGVEAQRDAEAASAAADRARRTAAGTESKVTIGNRIAKNEREVRDLERRLAGTHSSSRRVPEGDYRQRLEGMLAEAQDQLQHDRGKMAAAGGVPSKDSVSPGDFVKIRGQWYPVRKANAKTVGVPNTYGDRTRTAPWHEVSEHRKAGDVTRADVADMVRDTSQAFPNLKTALAKAAPDADPAPDAPAATPGGVTPDAARRMSDDQLERTMQRLMADGDYDGPAFSVIEKELNRRDKARRAEGNQ